MEARLIKSEKNFTGKSFAKHENAFPGKGLLRFYISKSGLLGI